MRREGRAGVEHVGVDRLDLGVFGSDDGAVSLFVGELDLVDHALVGGSSRVKPGSARCVDVVLADLEVAVPVAREQVSDLVAVGRKTGGGEQVGAVADGLGANVGAVRDEAAIGIRRGVGLPLHPAIGELGVREVGETVAVLHHLCEPVNLDSFDVGEATARAELGEEVVASIVRGGRAVVHDRDAGVLGLVLREHLVGVAEVVERGDRKGDVTPGFRGLGRAAAARCDEGEGGGAGECGGRCAAS